MNQIVIVTKNLIFKCIIVNFKNLNHFYFMNLNDLSQLLCSIGNESHYIYAAILIANSNKNKQKFNMSISQTVSICQIARMQYLNEKKSRTCISEALKFFSQFSFENNIPMYYGNNEKQIFYNEKLKMKYVKNKLRYIRVENDSIIITITQTGCSYSFKGNPSDLKIDNTSREICHKGRFLFNKSIDIDEPCDDILLNFFIQFYFSAFS